MAENKVIMVVLHYQYPSLASCALVVCCIILLEYKFHKKLKYKYYRLLNTCRQLKICLKLSYAKTHYVHASGNLVINNSMFPLIRGILEL